MSSATSARYHHGDLPNALKAAAVEVIDERGTAGFSLREVARRVGVSHAAPAHHFGDSTGLLTALAIDAFRALDAAMTLAEEGSADPVDRLTRIGQAYVAVGRTHPAHCSVVFRLDLVDATSAEYIEWGERAYGHLLSALEAIRDAHNPELDVADAARLCWATMQGLVVLYAGMVERDERHGEPLVSIEELAARFAILIMNGLRHSPSSAG